MLTWLQQSFCFFPFLFNASTLDFYFFLNLSPVNNSVVPVTYACNLSTACTGGGCVCVCRYASPRVSLDLIGFNPVAWLEPECSGFFLHGGVGMCLSWSSSQLLFKFLSCWWRQWLSLPKLGFWCSMKVKCYHETNFILLFLAWSIRGITFRILQSFFPPHFKTMLFGY